MNKEIAVFLDNEGKTAAFDEPGVVKIFRKENESWKVIKEFDFSLDPTKGLASIREQIAAMANIMDDCKVFIGKKVTGMAYNVLDKMGYNVWEFEDTPENYLDYVLAKEVKEEYNKEFEKDNSRELEKKKTPIETIREGYYALNLKELQNNKGKLTSKQVLLPFLKNTVFRELELICSHIPPWLERELERLKLEKEIVNVGTNEYKVVIRQKTFN